MDGSGVASFDLSGRGIEPGDQLHVYVPGRHNHGTEYIHGIPYAELGIDKYEPSATQNLVDTISTRSNIGMTSIGLQRTL